MTSRVELFGPVPTAAADELSRQRKLVIENYKLKPGISTEANKLLKMVNNLLRHTSCFNSTWDCDGELS